MNHSRIIVSLFAVGAIFFASCASTPVANDSEQTTKMSLVEYAASGKYSRPMEWKAGQYVEEENLTKGKRDSINRTLIVGKEKGGWIIESSSTDKKGKKSISQVLFLGMDEAVKNGNASGVSIGWMKMIDDDGNIQVLEGEQLMFYNMFSKETLESLVTDITTFTDGGSVSVPAGNFSGTNKVLASIKILGMKIETESWYHPAVPVNGMVKSRSTDGKTESRLISFGFDGKPELK